MQAQLPAPAPHARGGTSTPATITTPKRAKALRVAQVGYGHLSTLVKLDRKPVEIHGPEGDGLANGQHTDYKNTFDVLDSLLSAQEMNS